MPDEAVDAQLCMQLRLSDTAPKIGFVQALRRTDTNTNPISDHIITKYANNGYIAINVSHQDIHSQYALQLDTCIDLQTCQKLANMAHLIHLACDTGGAIG
ncbi:hypothetical protein BDR07DRAFT_1378419 [Suillus spraguei]|nr:hypothetical protein BDR07DRAFT_1378419 [Suillus spraguei]